MTQRWIAWVLLGLEAAAMAYLSNMQQDVAWYWWDTAIFPAGVVLAGLLAVIRRPAWDPTAAVFRRTVGLLCAACLVKYLLGPHEYRFFALFLFSSLAHAAAQFLMLWQLADLWRRTRQRRLPSWWVGLAAVVMICVADVQVTEGQRANFEWISVAFALAAAMFLGSGHTRRHTVPAGRRSRRLAMALVLLVAGGLAVAGSRALFHYTRNFEGLLRRDDVAGPGTRWHAESTQRRLGSVPFGRSGDDFEIALRVYSRDQPGYLKVRAFDHFERATWNSAPATRRLGRVEQVPAGLRAPRDTRPVFSVAPRPEAAADLDTRSITLWPSRRLATRIPLPRGTTHVRLAAGQVAASSDGVLVAEDLPPGYPLSLLVETRGTRGRPVHPDRSVRPVLPVLPVLPALPVLPVLPDHARLTALSPEIPAVAGKLAARLFAGCSSDAQRITAVERYFSDNYGYRLGVSVPGGEDPLDWFLTRKPDAHCEYFATAAAVLLRIAGVPCRYVTGYVVAERNRYGGYWVARRKDAHAWVEAFDRERGWVTVEATPGEGVPRPATAAQTNQWWESIRDRVQMSQIEFQEAGWIAIRTLVFEFLATVPGLALLVTFVVLLFRWAWPRWQRRPRRQRVKRDPLLEQLARLLARMDARLARQSLVRAPYETLHQFAQRLGPHASADWYRQYAEVRYSGAIDPPTLRNLGRGTRR